MIQGVLFDFDGTLVDYVTTDILCLKSVHNACGASCPADEFVAVAVDEIMKFHALVDDGKADPLSMHQFRLQNTLSRYGIRWDQKYVTLYQETMFDQTKPFAGVRTLLTAVKGRNVQLGIISNGYDGKEQRKRIECSGLAPFFAEIIISGDVGYAKPSSDIFRLALKRLALPADKTVYIGDLEKYDIKGANAAGMQTILLCRNRNPVSSEADHVCYSISEVEECIVKLTGG